MVTGFKAGDRVRLIGTRMDFELVLRDRGLWAVARTDSEGNHLDMADQSSFYFEDKVYVNHILYRVLGA